MTSFSNNLLFLVGLGNPGAQYHNTRHNIGFMLLDIFSKHLNNLQENNEKKLNIITASGILPNSTLPKNLLTSFKKEENNSINNANALKPITSREPSNKSNTQAQVKTKIQINNLAAHRNILLVKPQTYMNLSGQAILKLSSKYRYNIENMLIIADDLDFPFGEIRFKKSGSGGSHNGLKSVVSSIGKKFFRLRIGVGNPMQKLMPTDKFVLGKFDQNEAFSLEKYLNNIAEAVIYFSFFGIEKAMNVYNAKKLI